MTIKLEPVGGASRSGFPGNRGPADYRELHQLGTSANRPMLRGGCPRRRHGSLHYHGTLTTTWDSPALGHGNEMPDVTSPSGGVLGAVRPLPILDRRQEDTHGRLTAASEPAIPLQLGREDEVPLFLGASAGKVWRYGFMLQPVVQRAVCRRRPLLPDSGTLHDGRKGVPVWRSRDEETSAPGFQSRGRQSSWSAGPWLR